jgi:hypothetical protein
MAGKAKTPIPPRRDECIRRYCLVALVVGVAPHLYTSGIVNETWSK